MKTRMMKIEKQKETNNEITMLAAVIILLVLVVAFSFYLQMEFHRASVYRPELDNVQTKEYGSVNVTTVEEIHDEHGGIEEEYAADNRAKADLDEKVTGNEETVDKMDEEAAENRAEGTDYRVSLGEHANRTETVLDISGKSGVTKKVVGGKESIAADVDDSGFNNMEEPEPLNPTPETESDNSQAESESETKPAILTGLEYSGGLNELYCLAGKDLKPKDALIYGIYNNGNRKRISPGDFKVKGFSTSEEGKHEGTISYGGHTVRIPYEVAAFRAKIELNGGYFDGDGGISRIINDYIVQSIETPSRMVYQFDGWYLDKDFTRKAVFPQRVEEKVTHFYAKWTKLEGLFTMQGGVLISYNGTNNDTPEGQLLIPSNCTGIAAGAFKNNSSRISEISIEKKVVKIEAGAFSGMPYLSRINISPKNACYRDINNAVHSKDGKLLVFYPNALEGSYNSMTDETEVLGKYSFYESSLSLLSLSKELNGIEGYAFGPKLKTIRFRGETPPEFIDPFAFAAASKNLEIEVPNQSVDLYKKALAEVNPNLAKRVSGY